MMGKVDKTFRFTIEELQKKYPMESLEKHFENIEKVGYHVNASDDQCQIWDGEKLFIDADFYVDYHKNAVSAIYSFYYE